MTNFLMPRGKPPPWAPPESECYLLQMKYSYSFHEKMIHLHVYTKT